MKDNGVSFTDMKAYIDLFGIKDKNFFISAMKALEHKFMRLHNEQLQSTNKH